MEAEKLAYYIKSFELFKHLDHDTLQMLANEFEVEHFPVNAMIIKQGSYGDKIYFISEGGAQVFILNREGEEIVIGSLKEGDHFGEMALVIDGYRTASVRATSACKIFSLHNSHYQKILDKNPIVYKAINKVLSERLSATLNLVARKKENIVVLVLYSDEAIERVSHFEKYLTKISTKKIIVLENITSINAMMEKYHVVNNHIILIKNMYEQRISLYEHADHIINFVTKENQQYCLSAGVSQWQIEHTARVIMQKTIGIALSSGGAPGLAHLAVLQVLKDENIPLDYIVGSSAGALFGGCYAFGVSTKDIFDIVIRENNKSKLLTMLSSLSFKFNGVMKNKYYRNILKSIIGEVSLEEALIPFACVSSDLFSGQSIVIKQGSAIDAILASNSAPIIMEPFIRGDQLLIDGVATDPLPVQVLVDEKINIKIAVNIPQLDLTVQMKKNPKLLSVYLRSRSIMTERLASNSAALADVIIKPKIEGIHMFDWNSSERIMEQGKLSAHTAVNRIRCLFEQE